MIVSAIHLPEQDLRGAMNSAFADYAVAMKLGPDEFEMMMRVRGFSKAFSYVAMVDGSIAAFWFVGVRAKRAYLIASGTSPEFRQRGFSAQIGHATMDALKTAGKETIQAEVLEANVAARRLYSRLGFAEVRSLDCCSLDMLESKSAVAGLKIAEASDLADEVQDFWEVVPSWQNDTASVQSAGADARVLEIRDQTGLAAYAAIFPAQNSLAQIAVRNDRRREGLASALIAEGQRCFGLSSLRVINVDREDRRVWAFLRSCGAQRTVSQKEILRWL